MPTSVGSPWGLALWGGKKGGNSKTNMFLFENVEPPEAAATTRRGIVVGGGASSIPNRASTSRFRASTISIFFDSQDDLAWSAKS